MEGRPLLIFLFIQYFFEGIKPASIYAGALLSCRIPKIGTYQIPVPERPVAALRGANIVNRAAPALLGLPEEYTIACVRVLDNRKAQSHASEKLPLQFFDGHFQEIGNEADFGPAEPNIALLRPGAAMPALQTLELQSGRIPGNFILTKIHNEYFNTKFRKIDNRLLIIDDSKPSNSASHCNNQ